MKRTPLYELHKEFGGRMVDFAGWEMPIQYTSIIKEHQAVRTNAGIFDVSHMGEALVEGSEAQNFINRIITNDITRIRDGQIIYSPMCNEKGGVVDDVIIYKYNDQKFLIVLNASNTKKDVEWLLMNTFDGVGVTDISSEYSQLAIQGPKAQEILQRHTEYDLSSLKFFRFIDDFMLGGIKCLISRTGYTGEDGFEVYTSPKDAANLWNKIMSKDASEQDVPMPAGLGARDTLRMEAALPLYGHELNDDITPLEAGISNFVKLSKPDFIGRDKLITISKSGLKRELTGFVMEDRGIPRAGYKVYSLDGEQIGVVTSGGYSPSTSQNIGMAIVKKGWNTDSEYCIQIRGKLLKASVVKLPFYRKSYKK